MGEGLIEMGEGLIEIVPLRKNGERGLMVIIARANYDAWLATRGAELLADGFVKLIVAEHVGYEDRQLKGGRR